MMQNAPQKNSTNSQDSFRQKSRASKAAEIDRCQAEQAEIESRWAKQPQEVGAMIGWLDWEAEKHLIRAEQAVNQMR
jgi:hypothetical protein